MVAACIFYLDMVGSLALQKRHQQGQSSPAGTEDKIMNFEISDVSTKHLPSGFRKFHCIAFGSYIGGPEAVREFRTDKDGNGLFEWNAYKLEWKQILGSTQFTATSRRNMTLKIRKMLTAQA
jgi:hypothetical protein